MLFYCHIRLLNFLNGPVLDVFWLLLGELKI